jgi:hypothetical protein
MVTYAMYHGDVNHAHGVTAGARGLHVVALALLVSSRPLRTDSSVIVKTRASRTMHLRLVKGPAKHMISL